MKSIRTPPLLGPNRLYCSAEEYLSLTLSGASRIYYRHLAPAILTAPRIRPDSYTEQQRGMDVTEDTWKWAEVVFGAAQLCDHRRTQWLLH
jgi:hypothetical protein